MTTATKTTKIRERSYLGDSPRHAHKIDREAGIIRGVRVVGFESKNRRKYPKNVLEAALAHYEGADVNLDHNGETVLDRSIRDAWGVLSECKLEEDGIYADLPYLKSHPATEQLLEMAERFPRNFGLSHVAEGICHRDAQGVEIVDEILGIESVDVVRKPATNGGLFESKRRKKTSTVRDLLKGIESSPRAKALSRLLEEDAFGGFGDLSVDVPQLADPDAADEEDEADASLQAGVEELVLAIVRQDLTKDEKLARIEQVLSAGEAPNGGGGDQSQGENKDGTMTTKSGAAAGAAGSSATGATDAAELKAQVESLRKQLDLTKVFEEVGLSPKQLSEAQLKLVEAQTSRDNQKALLETLKSGIEAAQGEPDGGDESRRPVVRRAVESKGGGIGAAKYEDLLKEAKDSQGLRRAR